VLANKAALKAFLINKFGDIFLLIGILGLTIEYGSLDLEIIFSLLNPEAGSNFFITFMILIGVMSKSAQFGLHTWLPDAMEGLFWALPKFHYMLEQPHLIFELRE
jgi:NADH-quinone oxidoreductase subunit L